MVRLFAVTCSLANVASAAQRHNHNGQEMLIEDLAYVVMISGVSTCLRHGINDSLITEHC